MNIRREVRKKYLSRSIFTVIAVLVYTCFFSFIFCLPVKNMLIRVYHAAVKLGILGIVFVLFLALLFVLVVYELCSSVTKVINPGKSKLFELYTSEENIERMIYDIEKNIIYEYGSYIVSKNYIYDRKDVEKLIAVCDICEIILDTKIRKGNIVRYDIKIKTIYGYDYVFSFGEFSLEMMKKMLKSLTEVSDAEIVVKDK